MKVLKVALLAMAAILIGLVVTAPIGPLPGILIGGTSTQAPTQWPDTSSVHEIRLKVPGTLPRVVIIWVIDHGGDLHIVGASDSGWVRMLGAGGPVEMRLGDETYSLKAIPVTEGWQPVLDAYVEKYRPDYPDIVAGFPSVEDAKGQMSVFRLDRI